jgi:hypothetical protein
MLKGILFYLTMNIVINNINHDFRQKNAKNGTKNN